MKKTIALFLCLTLVLLMGAGCKPSTTQPVQTESKPTEAAQTSQADTAVKTGLAVITSIAKSTEPGEKEGLAQVDSVVVALTIGSDGKIVKCMIDTAQTKINFSKEGKITTPLDTAFKSKQDMGAEYGLGKASGIKKEWNEQANALADYVIGKTIDEVKGIAVNEEGVPTNTDLTASVTIHITDYVKAIEKAAANAKDLGAKSGDKLGLGVTTTISKSKDAAEEDGVAQAYSNYAATTIGADSKITSCIIEASQTDIKFTKEGKLTTDLASVPQTKTEIGEGYGLKKVSSISKEWFEQAGALAKYVVGKTIDEVKGIAVNEEGVPTGTDLTGSVTIHISDYTTVIEKGAANAK